MRSTWFRISRAVGVTCATALVFASFGPAPAQAAHNCAVNTAFLMAETQICNASTWLIGGVASPELGISTSAVGARAIEGFATAFTGNGYGIYGDSNGDGNRTYGVRGVITNVSAGSFSAGVAGTSQSTNSSSFGVLGEQTATNGTAAGVYGKANSEMVNGMGVGGEVSSSIAGPSSAGVRGINNSTTGNGFGVWGSQAGSGIGVLGTTAGGGYGVAGAGGAAGVLGYSLSPGFAGYFVGNVNITGTLTKGAGAFRIDHPLDPANKYLQHSFVESPDMKNVYDGVVTTDRHGFATVTLPAYFQALNRDFRYQLTIVGRSFAKAIIWSEVANNRFRIRTDEPNVKVSWQVTGIRKDRFANAHRIQPELPKPAGERGTYLNPELYGRPRAHGVLRLPAVLRTAQIVGSKR